MRLVEKYPIGFQKVVVRLLVQDPSFLDMTLDNLSPAFFEHPVHRWFVRKVVALRQSFGSRATKNSLDLELRKDLLDKTLVESEEAKYRAFLERIEKPVPDAPYIKEEIASFIKRQKQRTAILKASELYDASRPAHEIDAAFLQAVSFTARATDQMTFLGPDLRARIRRRRRVVKGIPTGLEQIDRHFDHRGIPPTFSGCLIGPPGRGKTLWLVALGVAALQHGFKVLHYTLEMPKDMILDRYDSAITGIELSDLRRKPKTLKKLWRKFGDIGNNLVVREEPPGLNVNGIRAHLRELESLGFVPDLLIIDYADEMSPAEATRREDGSYEKQGQIYVELNVLLKEKGIACWTASQAKRESLEKDTIDLNDIGDSWNKAKKAFIVLALCQTKVERENQQMRVAILKNRDGPTGGRAFTRVSTSKICITELAESESVFEESRAGNYRSKAIKTMQPKPKAKEKDPKKFGTKVPEKVKEKWASLSA